MKSTVGKNIVKSRKEQGMSQEQLAQKLHVTRQAVSNWETGRSQPGLDMLEALAGAFGTDILVSYTGRCLRVRMRKPGPPPEGAIW